jgi:hypothetical protein
MTFDDWWAQLSPAEHKTLGKHNCHFVWQECQQHTLMTIQEACKAQTAYDQGFKDGQAAYKIHLAGWTLTPGVQPGMIWISAADGEGGDFHIHELAKVIGEFYKEKF